MTTAKLNGLNPETYLKDILAKVADGHTINRTAERTGAVADDPGRRHLTAIADALVCMSRLLL